MGSDKVEDNSIRGATTIEDNNEEKIIQGTKDLLLEMQNKNNLNKDNVISICFHRLKI